MSSGRRFGAAAWATVAAMAALVVVGCEEPNRFVPPPPPKVTVANPTQEDVIDYLEFTGRLVEYSSVEIRARVEGVLMAVHFEEGDLVEKGALLYTLDPAEYDAAVRQSQASVDDAQAALDLAEATLKRTEEAAKTNAVSGIDVLVAKAKRDQAAAGLAARRADLEKASLDRGYTEIRAPIAGFIGRTIVYAGNLVGAGERTLLTKIYQLDPIYVDYEINERDLLDLMAERATTTAGTAPEDRLEALRRIPLELGLVNEAGYPFSGHVHYADPAVDPDTGTLRLRGIFENPQPPKLLPGFFARVRTPFRKRDSALLVPEVAIGTDLGGKFVLVVNAEGVVEQRPVKIGPLNGVMRVIESGVEASDRVIVQGLLRARPGAPVDAQTREAPAAATPASGSTGQQ